MAVYLVKKSLAASAKCVCTVRPNIQKLVRNLISKQLVYNQFGEPLDVVKFREARVPPLGSQEVLVKMLAAPVNPADINTIQGKYPVKVNLPCIPGNEGVGTVEAVGTDVQGITLGDKVIVTKPVQGTWRDIAIFSKDVLKVVPDSIGLVEAATLTVNPCTAYRMLTDFVPIKKQCSVVIQNGANSACGQNVIQICKAWGIQNINIVRNRPDIQELKVYLENLGATYVLTEEELRTTTLFKEKKIEKPSLALNCVGGKSSLEMLRHLQHSGKMVTYGGMSRDPVTIPTSAFIFKNLAFYGFWMTAWNDRASQKEKDSMMSELITLISEKKLKGPSHQLVKFENYSEALKNALSSTGFVSRIKPCLPQLPSIPGDEGVGEVVEVGRLVGLVEPGQRVILSSRLLGSWRHYGIYSERDLHVVSPKLPLVEASMLSIAPCTAYRMIKDFKENLVGETVIQNGANSACGQSVIQLCKAWGINTFNVVAGHYGFENLKEHLYSLGATTVYTLQEAEQVSEFTTSLNRPKLAINCLGGRHEDLLLKLLDRQGAMVYYGSAYHLPLVKRFLRCDVKFYKFDLHNWSAGVSCVEKDIMITDIIQLMVLGKFRAPLYEPIEMKNFIHALRDTSRSEAFSVMNYVFDLTLP